MARGNVRKPHSSYSAKFVLAQGLSWMAAVLRMARGNVRLLMKAPSPHLPDTL